MRAGVWPESLIPCVSQGTKHPFKADASREKTLIPCVSQGTKHPFEADASCEKIKHSLLIYFGDRASDERSLPCVPRDLDVSRDLYSHYPGNIVVALPGGHKAGNERTRKHASADAPLRETCLLQTNIQLFQLREMLLQQIMPELIAPTPSLQQQSACSIIEKAPIIPGYCSTPI